MRHIPLREELLDKLDGWVEKSKKILNELKVEQDSKKRKAIIRRNQKHWRAPELLAFLRALSHGKCWYTEARLLAEHPHLEHFRPKSCARDENWQKCHEGYWWLAFDITNYRLSKPVPNVKKGVYFPLQERVMAVTQPGIALTRERPMLIDPIDPDDVELISFNSLGVPEPCPEPPVDLDEWDLKRIEFSIERYGLDSNDLCEARKALWLSITSMFEEYAENALKAKRERCAVSAGKAIQIKEELKKFFVPEQEFTRVVKICFCQYPLGRQMLAAQLDYQKAA